MIFTLLSAIKLIPFSLHYISPQTPYQATSPILPPNAKWHFWDDEWVTMSDGYWLRQTGRVWESWDSHGKYKQSSCSSSIRLFALTRMQEDSILKHSHKESIPTELQMHCTITSVSDGHTDLLVISVCIKDGLCDCDFVSFYYLKLHYIQFKLNQVQLLCFFCSPFGNAHWTTTKFILKLLTSCFLGDKTLKCLPNLKGSPKTQIVIHQLTPGYFTMQINLVLSGLFDIS